MPKVQLLLVWVLSSTEVRQVMEVMFRLALVYQQCCRYTQNREKEEDPQSPTSGLHEVECFQTVMDSLEMDMNQINVIFVL